MSLPAAAILEARVGEVVDEIGVIAAAADHQIDAAGAIDQVVAAVAIDRIGLVVAIGLQIGAALQDQALDISGERVVGGRKYGVIARVRALECRIGDVVDEVGVVAGAADHEIGADAAASRLLPALP